MSATHEINHKDANNAVKENDSELSPLKIDAAVGSAANVAAPDSPADAVSPNADSKKTPVRRTPSKRMSFIERAQKESEELVRTMGGTLELEGGRRTRSSARGTPSRSATSSSPTPAKKARTSPSTPGRGRGRGRKSDTATPEAVDAQTKEEKAAETAAETTPKKGKRKKSEPAAVAAESVAKEASVDAEISSPAAESEPTTAEQDLTDAAVNDTGHAESQQKVDEKAEPQVEEENVQSAVKEPVEQLENNVDHKPVEAVETTAMEVDAEASIEDKNEKTPAVAEQNEQHEPEPEETPVAMEVDAAEPKTENDTTENDTETDAVAVAETTTETADVKDTNSDTVVKELAEATTTDNNQHTNADEVVAEDLAPAPGASEEIVKDLAEEAPASIAVNTNNNDDVLKDIAVPELTNAAEDLAKVQNELCEAKTGLQNSMPVAGDGEASPVVTSNNN